MAEAAETELKSIALIHNSSLPSHLGKLSKILALDCQRCYCMKPELVIHILDVADFDIPSSSSSSTSTTSNGAKRPLSEWRTEITKHVGFVLLFPYHIWAHATTIKDALSSTVFPTSTYARTVTGKPVLIVGFGKEDLWRANPPGSGGGWTQRTWSRKSFPMMRDWAVDRGLKVMPPKLYPRYSEDGSDDLESTMEEYWPEFICFDDYWTEWERTGEVIIGGQQSEMWESAGFNRCQTGMTNMIKFLDGKSRRK